jgi:hypothetical protein
MIDAAEGKVAYVDVRPLLCGSNDKWYRYGTEECKYPLWDWYRYDYRAAPEPKYRPYTPQEVTALFGTEVCRVGDSSPSCLVVGAVLNWDMPSIIFLRRRGSDSHHNVPLEDLLANYTHLDGTPCGVEVQHDA